MIVDTHVHIISSDEERYPLRPAAGFRMRGLRSWHREMPVSAEQLLEAMDGAGVDRAIVVQPFSAYGFDNSYHADGAARYPERLASICTVDPLAGDAAQRLRFWVKERGMQGLRLTTNSDSARLDDPGADALWREAATLAIPICVLTTPDHWGEVQVQAERFSSVPILLDHVGGSGGAESEEQIRALVALASLTNLSLKISTVNLAPQAARDEAGLQRWRRIVTAFGAERLLWGSNYPVSQEGSYADMVNLGRTSLPFLSVGERDQMLAGNALRFWTGLT